MATIVATDMTGSGEREVTFTTLTASDTFTYNESKNPVLVIYNDTGAPITPNIDGSGATTVLVAGIGSVDVSGGYEFGSIADGEYFAIPLKTINKYLSGTIAMTGGDAAECALLEF